jgi:mRNA interferase RelE/StbE
MAVYSITILPSVINKDLAKLSKKDVHKIMHRIDQLADDPRPIWSKKLSNREEYRARQGNHRILYVIEERIKIVQVTKVGHRKNIYE